MEKLTIFIVEVRHWYCHTTGNSIPYLSLDYNISVGKTTFITSPTNILSFVNPNAFWVLMIVKWNFNERNKTADRSLTANLSPLKAASCHLIAYHFLIFSKSGLPGHYHPCTHTLKEKTTEIYTNTLTHPARDLGPWMMRYKVYLMHKMNALKTSKLKKMRKILKVINELA